MVFLSWLFGKPKTATSRTRKTGDWDVSENGNPVLVVGSSRITVFQQDRGWKYCIADIGDQQQPHFSDPYASQQIAMDEALAHFRGEPARHASIYSDRAKARKEKWESLIQERETLTLDLSALISANPDLKITALRRPLAKIESHLKQIDWQVAQYRIDGVAEKLIKQTAQHQGKLLELRDKVAERISDLEAARKPRKSPISASTLSAGLAKTVDELIQEFNDTPVMSDAERDKLYREFSKNALSRMLNYQQTFGEASEAPEFLNQEEDSFRQFMKTADQDLQWQCETVATSFCRYRKSGEVPAPHYPMRIAILLSKAKDFNRERQFLAAWCKHFPTGNGTTYAALVKRAKKTGTNNSDPR